MKYAIKASSSSKNDGSINIKQTEIIFGTTPKSEDSLANPAELFLGSLSACILKNVERFSVLLNFEYSNAEIIVSAIRLTKPARIDEVNYELIIHSQDKEINVDLLKRNIEKFGTIFNTISSACAIVGDIKIVEAN